MIKYSPRLNSTQLHVFVQIITQSDGKRRLVLTFPLRFTLHLQVNDDKAQPTSPSELPGDSAWTRKTVTHSILYNFADFMTDAVRAINYMKAKLLRPVVVRGDDWLLKHEQWTAWPCAYFIQLVTYLFIYLFIAVYLNKQILFLYLKLLESERELRLRRGQRDETSVKVQ